MLKNIANPSISNFKNGKKIKLRKTINLIMNKTKIKKHI